MKNTAAGFAKVEVKPAVLCDFDDTPAIENVAELLLERFGTDGWREARRQHGEKLITLKEYQERAFNTVKVDRETMKTFVKEKATLRPYFKDLWYYCQSKGIPLAIASLGLDFYVEALLEREGLSAIPHYAATTCFTTHGIQYSYQYTWEGCWQPGNCKCRILKQYRSRGHSIVFAGDGRSDICPAEKSDVVFARRFLADDYRQRGLSFHELTDFQGVLKMVQDLMASRPENA